MSRCARVERVDSIFLRSLVVKGKRVVAGGEYWLKKVVGVTVF